MWPSSCFPQTLESDDIPLDKSFSGILKSLASAVGCKPRSQEAVPCGWISKACFLQTFQSVTKGPTSLEQWASSLCPLPCPFHRLSRALINSLQSGEALCPKEGHRKLPRKPSTKQTAFQKQEPFLPLWLVLLYHSILSLTFIRNLVINHSLEARSCQGRCLQLSPLPCPG